jgi:hypothetical protein
LIRTLIAFFRINYLVVQCCLPEGHILLEMIHLQFDLLCGQRLRVLHLLCMKGKCRTSSAYLNPKPLTTVSDLENKLNCAIRNEVQDSEVCIGKGIPNLTSMHLPLFKLDTRNPKMRQQERRRQTYSTLRHPQSSALTTCSGTACKCLNCKGEPENNNDRLSFILPHSQPPL